MTGVRQWYSSGAIECESLTPLRGRERGSEEGGREGGRMGGREGGRECIVVDASWEWRS